VASALAPATRAVYTAHIEHFRTWLADNNLLENELAMDHVLAYLTTEKAGMSHSTREGTLAAIRKYLWARGVSLQNPNRLDLDAILAGLERAQGRAAPASVGMAGTTGRQARPILGAEVEQIISNTDTTTQDGLTFAAQLATAWTRGLRISEHADGAITWGDISWAPALVIHIRRAKGKGTRVASSFAATTPTINPPALLARLHAAQGHPAGDTAVFRYGPRQQAEPPAAFNKRLREATPRDPTRTAHGLRAGMATQMHLWGVNDTTIMQLGAWNDPTTARGYIRASVQVQAEALRGAAGARQAPEHRE
jgi:site-specific recombinase XerD